LGLVNRQGRIVLFRLLCGVLYCLLELYRDFVCNTVCYLVGLRMDKQKVLGIYRKEDDKKKMEQTQRRLKCEIFRDSMQKILHKSKRRDACFS